MALFPIKLLFFEISSVVELIILIFVAGAVLFWVYLYFSNYMKDNKKTIANLLKKEEAKESKPKLVRNFFLKTVAVLEERINENNKKGVLKEFSVGLKKFFGEIYDLDYRFTYDELIGEITKIKMNGEIKDRIIQILGELSKMEYSNENISLDGIKNIMSSSEKLVNDLMNVHAPEAMPEKEKKISKTEKSALNVKNSFQKFFLRLGIYTRRPVKERIEEARMIRSIKKELEESDGKSLENIDKKIGDLEKRVGGLKKTYYSSPLDNLQGKWLVIDTANGSFKGRMKGFDGEKISLEYVIRLDHHLDDVIDFFEINKKEIKRIGVEFLDEDLTPKLATRMIKDGDELERRVSELLPEIKAR